MSACVGSDAGDPPLWGQAAHCEGPEPETGPGPGPPPPPLPPPPPPCGHDNWDEEVRADEEDDNYGLAG